eukprot:CAMPEP_0119068128 /NCGR_PEP_ID=MMETSP1178-20130426/10516_1 /TAXON_ID=33656 /ORGANISM="unid sp, Strain CCMP2000" /LENGTH=45 /DNA_ID= /DNA_START= /DNA_END= /DNA_ORIENTATION=
MTEGAPSTQGTAAAPGILSGCTFALSTAGESQSKLTALIAAGGGE